MEARGLIRINHHMDQVKNGVSKQRELVHWTPLLYQRITQFVAKEAIQCKFKDTALGISCTGLFLWPTFWGMYVPRLLGICTF